MVSPMQCRVITEVMPTWRALWRQRMRWQRGALENIGAYGLTRATVRYWLQQIGIGYGTIALNAYLLLMLITLLAADSFQILLVLDRRSAASSSSNAWSPCGPPAGAAGLLALPLVIEIAYDLVLQAVYVKSLFDIATGRAAGWNYVPRVPGRSVQMTILAGILLPAEVLSSGWFQALAAFVAINTLVYAASEPREADPAATRMTAGPGVAIIRYCAATAGRAAWASSLWPRSAPPTTRRLGVVPDRRSGPSVAPPWCPTRRR